MAKNDASLPQDFTSALNLTLKPGKIIVVALGLVVGIAIAIVSFWLGGMIKAEGLHWLSWIVQRAGGVIFAYVVLAAMCSAVAMAHAESRNERIGVASGWALIAKNIGPVVLGTLKPILVFICSVAIIWLAGLLGAIPKAGPILWAIISVVPLAAGVLAILTLMKLFLVSFVFPAALSVNRANGTACYKESSRFIKTHVAHFLGRLGIAAVLCLVLYRIVFAGFAVTAAHSSRTMGNNKVTLHGSRLFDYVAGVPGISGTAPRGFGMSNPTRPFLEVEAPAKAAKPDLKSILKRGLAGGATAKTSHKVGGWIFSFVFLVFATIPLSIPLVFFGVSGYRAFVSLKDVEEIPLETEAMDWSKLKGSPATGGEKGETKAPPKEEKRASRKRPPSSAESEEK
ncbi:MAG: hypothetical protein Q8Q12_00290 [bacterium]|nr:hypothetical protein [bacterium]